MNAYDLPYRNSRTVENAKRTIRKNEAIRHNTNIKILKNTRERIVSSLNARNSKELVIDAMRALGTKGKSRETIRLLAEAIEKLKAEEKSKKLPSKEEIIAQVPKLEPKKTAINRVEIMNRIHKTLTKHNASSTDRARNRGWPVSIKKLLENKKLTYCPEEITLTNEDIEQLTLKGSTKEHKYSASQNWLIIVKKLLAMQEALPEEQKISTMTSKSSVARIQVLEDSVVHGSRPMIVIDRDKLYEKLKFAKIMNSNNNPGCKVDITTVSDFNIITYFNSVAHGLLSYFRCADDFFRMKSIVNWFIRYSAISTIKHKHKLSSRKTVFEKFGVNPTFNNQKGKTVSLISREHVMGLNREFLIKPDIDWHKRMNQI